MDERIAFARDTLLLSYSRVFFAESRLLGLCIMFATMVSPGHGLFGLLGGLFANLFAWRLGMDREGLGKGVYGFNGILTGLALTYSFAPNLQLLFTLLAASLVLTLITIGLNQLLFQYCGLPALSMPLNLVTWLILSAALRIGNLNRLTEHWTLVSLPADLLPWELGQFLTAIGAALFQTNPVSGLIIAIGVLCWSRIAMILLTAGFFVALWAQGFLGLEQGDLSSYCLDFNHMFAALAIGGIFTIPGPGSFCLALAAAVLSVLILAGSMPIFPDFLSPLALSFNLTVFLLLYALRLRCQPSLGVQLVTTACAAPEKNLNRYRENLRSWKHWGLPIALPFFGRWTVSQGIEGKNTHRGDWRFAYDFQAVDDTGNTFCGRGGSREDYFCYGLPVLAPADGTVQTVKDGVIDNLIGHTNQQENWGNCVIIAHSHDLYSCLAHLQPGSMEVQPGEIVKRGQVVGLCGNSGRSPYPHLHLQFQLSSLIGAASVPFQFANLQLDNNSSSHFLSRGTIDEGAIVENTLPLDNWREYFPCRLGDELHFSYCCGERERPESWKVGVDFYGNSFLVSAPEETRLYFRFDDGLFTVNKLTGSRKTGLYLFGSRCPEIPLIKAGGSMVWTAKESADYLVSPLLSRLLDPLALFGCYLQQQLTGEISRTEGGLWVSIKPVLCLKIPLLCLPLRKLPVANCHLSPASGPMMTRAGQQTLLRQTKTGRLAQAA